ncbi:MAG: zf-HC2 domain-containing protein [Solirubrobacterales bacterium]
MSEPSEEMVCDELVELVTSYIEGTLPEADRGRLEHHLTECSWCEDYIAQHREVISALGRLDEGEPAAAEPAFAELLAVLRERRGEGS